MTTAEKLRFDPTRALEDRTLAVDAQVLNAWQTRLAPAVPVGAALVAVGGYGRRQLFPCSDIDLLLLFASDKAALAHKEEIAAFLQQLWDAGLRVSQSVRTPAECAELHDGNIELSVSLLDQRYLAGDAAVYGTLMEKLPRFVHGQRDALVRHLSHMTRERHTRFNGTFHHLEPNIKEAPGGLRDLQLISWLAQIAGSTPHAFSPLVRVPELDEARRFLFAVRTYLHEQAKRDSNVLTFDAQEWVAEQMGLDETAVMGEYFRSARAVHRSALGVLETEEARASSLFAQFRDRRSRVSNADFTVARERVYFRSPHQLEAEPELLLRLMQFVARHGMRLSLEAEQRMAPQLPAVRAYFASPRAVWSALSEALALPHAALALRVAYETGALTAMFPELERIDCLVIRDFFHRYTVDEHTLVAIQTLTDLPQQKAAPASSFAGLLSEIEEPAVLMFALLFHDVGKGVPKEGHVDASLRLVERAMERIQMPAPQRDTVRFLIRNHLEMSATMNGRDPFDPATARDLAGIAGTVENLQRLTLVTYADISAVNPTVMTPWRAGLLWQLYLLTYNELTRELESERIEEAGSPEETAFLEGFPKRYLRTHTEADIALHMRLEQESRARGVAVNLEKSGSVYRVTLVTVDRPFLFATVAGTLSSFGMNILKAEAFANRRGAVLDTFSFADPLRTLELNPTEADRLRATVERAVLGRADVKQLLRSRPHIAPPSRKARIEPSVHFDDQASQSATLIQVVAEDRPGLLYDIASTISSLGASIDVVLIDTEAHKAIDVFYVTAERRKLAAGKQEELLQALLAVLRGHPSASPSSR
jgi:[protein-PII] uridylyltransferase